MLKKLLRKKNIEQKSGEQLNRCLNAFDLTLLGIGCIIGTGIFVLTGIAAANQAGPAVILSFLASGFACAFAALSYAELSSSVGGCGLFTYSYQGCTYTSWRVFSDSCTTSCLEICGWVKFSFLSFMFGESACV